MPNGQTYVVGEKHRKFLNPIKLNLNTKPGSSLFQNHLSATSFNVHPKNRYNFKEYIDQLNEIDKNRIKDSSKLPPAVKNYIDKLGIEHNIINKPVKFSSTTAAIITLWGRDEAEDNFNLGDTKVSTLFKTRCLKLNDYLKLIKQALYIQEGRSKYWGAETYIIGHCPETNGDNLERIIDVQQHSYAPDKINRYKLDAKFYNLNRDLELSRIELKNIREQHQNNSLNIETIENLTENMTESFDKLCCYSVLKKFNIERFIKDKISNLSVTSLDSTYIIDKLIESIEKEFVITGTSSFEELIKTNSEEELYPGIKNELKLLKSSKQNLNYLFVMLSKTRTMQMITNSILYDQNSPNNLSSNPYIKNSNKIQGLIVGDEHAKHIRNWSISDVKLADKFKVFTFDQTCELEYIIPQRLEELLNNKLMEQQFIEHKKNIGSDLSDFVPKLEKKETANSYDCLINSISSTSSDKKLSEDIINCVFFENLDHKAINQLIQVCQTHNLYKTLEAIKIRVAIEINQIFIESKNRVEILPLIKIIKNIKLNLDSYLSTFITNNTNKFKYELFLILIFKQLPENYKKTKRTLEDLFLIVINKGEINQKNRNQLSIMDKLLKPWSLFAENDLELSEKITTNLFLGLNCNYEELTNTLNALLIKQMPLTYQKIIDINKFFDIYKVKTSDLKASHTLVLDFDPLYCHHKENRVKTDTFSIVLKFKGKKILSSNKLDISRKTRLLIPITLTSAEENFLDITLFQNDNYGLKYFFRNCTKVLLGTKRINLNRGKERIEFNGDNYKKNMGKAKYTFSIIVSGTSFPVAE